MGNCTSISKTPLFINKPAESNIYRIPALIYIKETQTFLAFAEHRTSKDDVDATLLVMRRGTQLGKRSIQWSPVEKLKTACLEEYRTMNPCPVYETESKTVFLFFNCVLDKKSEADQIKSRTNMATLCYVTSTDNGMSWSHTTDLTKCMNRDEIKKWATFSVGPGHGLQMSNGRLIVPAYVYYINFLGVTPHAFAFYSDDKGKTWHFGQRVSVQSTECLMAEVISNGHSYLYCNARSPHQCSSSDCCCSTRVEAWSKNAGEDFDSVLYSGKLVETQKFKGCQGSVVRFKHEDETWLLSSHPTDRKERKNLGISLNKSPFSASSWSKPCIINRGLSGYSDLTQGQDKDRFACLMECGRSDFTEITFVEFSLRDIMKNQ